MSCPRCREPYMITEVKTYRWKVNPEAMWYKCGRCGCEFGIKEDRYDT
jgi:hypothetical protein